MIGTRNLFRGYTAKVWTGTNFTEKKYRKLNRIAVRLSVQHYYECWIERNKIYHNERIQSKRIMNWYQKVKESMINSQYPQVQAFILRNELDPTKTKPHVL